MAAGMRHLAGRPGGRGDILPRDACDAPLMRTGDLSKTLDHTVVGPETSREDIERACDLARRFHVAALCASPRFTRLVAGRLRDSDVRTCVRIPGQAGGSAAIEAAQRAVWEGADELDVAINIAALRSGAFRRAREELARVVAAARVRAANDARGAVTLKAIIEAPLLDEAHVRLACKIVADAGADFATTSSAVAIKVSSGEVELMREALPESVGVLASGGVRTAAEVQEMICAGAARVGTARAVDVLEEIRATSGRSQR